MSETIARPVDFPPMAHFAAMPSVGMIFDIGCDRLIWSTPFLRKAFPDAVIHGFEPDPRNADFIRETKADEKLRVNFHQMAMGARKGTCEFWQSRSPEQGDWPWSSSTKRPKSFENNPGSPFRFTDEPIQVQCSTIDEFCMDNSITSIDLVCMDVQGAEGDVLRGATVMLPHIRFIYAEHSSGDCYTDEPGLAGLKSLLSGWGVVECWPYDVLFRNPNPQ